MSAPPRRGKQREAICIQRASSQRTYSIVKHFVPDSSLNYSHSNIELSMRQLFRSTSKPSWGAAVGESWHTSTFGRGPPSLAANKPAHFVGSPGDWTDGVKMGRLQTRRIVLFSCSFLPPLPLPPYLFTLEMHMDTHFSAHPQKPRMTYTDTHRHTLQCTPTKAQKNTHRHTPQCTPSKAQNNTYLSALPSKPKTKGSWTRSCHCADTECESMIPKLISKGLVGGWFSLGCAPKLEAYLEISSWLGLFF